MDGSTLLDRISRGMGVAARKIGLPYTVFRPRSPMAPLATRNRIVKLYASFNAEDSSYRRVSGYGEAIWWGVYDSSYTQPGDYLVGPDATFFVSAQRPVLPVQCVRVNRTLTLFRTLAPPSLGYAGEVKATATPLLAGWPGSLFSLGLREAASSRSSRLGEWRLLLPPLPLPPQPGDLIEDDLGGDYVIGGAELSDLGWRLSLKQITA